MGENKASYMMKQGVDMLPEADQDVSIHSIRIVVLRKGLYLLRPQEIKGIRKNAKNVLGEGAKNPLGKFVSHRTCAVHASGYGRC